MLNSSFVCNKDWPGEVIEMIDRGFDMKDPYMLQLVLNIQKGSLTRLWRDDKFRFPIQNSVNAVGNFA